MPAIASLLISLRFSKAISDSKTNIMPAEMDVTVLQWARDGK